MFISLRDNAVSGLTDEMKEALKGLGLETDWSNKLRWSYYAVILPGETVIEKASKDALTITGGFRDNRSVYTITSKGYDIGNEATITMDGAAYPKNGRGFNIVVYNNAISKVIDSVRFDTGVTNVTVTAIR